MSHLAARAATTAGEMVALRAAHPLLVEDDVVVEGDVVLSLETADLHRRQREALYWAADAIAEGRMRGQHCGDEARIAVRTYLEHMHATDRT